MTSRRPTPTWRQWAVLRLWAVLLCAGLLLAAPARPAWAAATESAPADAPTAAPDGPRATVRMARPTWDTGWFQAEVYRQLLIELGYEVEGPQTLDNTDFYRAVAEGEVDFWASGWFPLHQQYLDEDGVGDAVEIVGNEVEAGALQGYLMDRATAEQRGITTIEALRDPDVARLFDVDGNGRADLIGCNVDWACADIIDHQIDDFGLSDTVEQIQGDYSLLMRETVDRYEAGEPVLFYTFTPNWTVGELVPGTDVRWLETPSTSRPEGLEVPDAAAVGGLEGCASDPCRTGWPVNDIQVVANRRFLQENDAARRLLEAVEIPLDDILAQNARMVEGEGDFSDIERQAASWIERNTGRVDDWLAAADPSTVAAGGDQRAATGDGSPVVGTLRVAARAFPPFVIYEDRRFGGFSVELIDLIAEELDVDHELYGVNTIAKQLDDVQRGAADVAVAGVSITSEHEQLVDFTHPIFNTGLQVMVPADEQRGPLGQMERITTALLRSNVLWLVLFFGGALLASAHLVWWFERRDNPEFHQSYRQGIWDSFWWSAVTVTTVGYGDKAPKGHLGKGWALLWMIIGYFIFASFTASITSTLAIDELRSTINGPDDLAGNRIATVAGSPAESYLTQRGVGPVTVARVEDAYAELDTGAVDAIAFDAPVLQFHAAREGRGTVQVVGPLFEQVRYGIAVAHDSPLREEFNGALLEIVESGAYDRLRERWFGRDVTEDSG